MQNYHFFLKKKFSGKKMHTFGFFLQKIHPFRYKNDTGAQDISHILRPSEYA